jgi:predicted RNA-binding Zn ribbon-like protein
MDAESLVGLGDHPALDFVNSTATPARETIELIGDGQGYLRWLELAGLISTGEREALQVKYSPGDLDRAAAAATGLREWLRPLIARWAAGDPAAPSGEQVAHLNKMLAAASEYPQLARTDGAVTLTRRRTWATPQALLALPAGAAADLLAHGDRSLVRNCEGPACTLWFYDRTKAHQRRWCSMALCGNRAKARAHRARLPKHIPRT